MGVSAGFDAYLKGGGGLLEKRTIGSIGKAIREGEEDMCGGTEVRRAGGVYHPDLKWCVKSFVEGFGLGRESAVDGLGFDIGISRSKY